MDDVVARGVAVRLAAKSLVLALEKFMVASTNLVLPFWSDLAVVGYATWTVLDNRTKGWVVLVVAVGYSLVAAYRKAVKLKDKHGGTVKALLFQASFLIAAPALWFGLPCVQPLPPFVPPAIHSLFTFDKPIFFFPRGSILSLFLTLPSVRSHCVLASLSWDSHAWVGGRCRYLLPGSLLPLVVSGLLSVAPAAYSCVAFASSGAGTVRGLFHMGKRPQSQVELEMGRCLSYWACWPTVKVRCGDFRTRSPSLCPSLPIPLHSTTLLIALVLPFALFRRQSVVVTHASTHVSKHAPMRPPTNTRTHTCARSDSLHPSHCSAAH